MNLYSVVYLLKKLTSELEKEEKEEKNLLSALVKENIEHYHLIKKDTGLVKIKSTQVDEYLDYKGFNTIDFGSGMTYDALFQDNKVILFKYKTSEDFFPKTTDYKKKREGTLTLKNKEALATALGLPPKKTTLHEIVEKLNLSVDTNYLKVKEGKPFFVSNRTKRIDKEMALENITTGDIQPFWAEELEGLNTKVEHLLHSNFTKERKKQISELKGLAEKFISIAEGKGEFEENPYINLQKGRLTVDAETIPLFIEELDEKNPDLVTQITSIPNKEPKLTIKGEYSYEEILSFDKSLKSFLMQEYRSKMEYRAQRENENKETVDIPSPAFNR